MYTYAHSFRTHRSTKQRGAQGSYPIKLFYTSNMPIILQTALVSNLYFFSQILYKRFSSNIFVGLLGRWEDPEFSPSGSSIPVGGLAYYVSPPQSFSDMLSDPFHTVFYITFVLSTCALFSKVLAPSPPVERRSCHCHLDACRPRGTNSQLLNLARDLFDLQMVPHRKYSRAQHVRDQSVCGW